MPLSTRRLRRTCLLWLALLSPVLFSSALLRGDEVSDLVRVIKGVGSEAQGNQAASEAWKRLVQQDGKALVPLLSVFDDASPLSANWLRSAVETIAQKELDKGRKLPQADLEKFIRDTTRSPQARRLAYDLLLPLDNTLADRLIPGMLNDPSVEFRRDAVARLLAQAKKLDDAKDNEAAKKVYLTAFSGARDEDQIQQIAKRLKELGETVDIVQHLGFITRWKLMGPFDNTGKKGFDVAYPPEKSVDFTATHPGKSGDKLSWTDYTTPDSLGMVDLKKAQDHHKGAITYAASEFFSTEKRDVDVRFATPNAYKIWLNGQLLFARDEYHRGTKLDQYRMRATLNPGKNVFLVKICQNEQTEDWAQRWQFQLRITDHTGTAVLSAQK